MSPITMGLTLTRCVRCIPVCKLFTSKLGLISRTTMMSARISEEALVSAIDAKWLHSAAFIFGCAQRDVTVVLEMRQSV